MCHFANYSAQPFLDIGHIEARSVFACTQRKDAATVSYTEIVVGSGTVLMRLLAPDSFGIHGRPSVQEYRLRLKQPPPNAGWECAVHGE